MKRSKKIKKVFISLFIILLSSCVSTIYRDFYIKSEHPKEELVDTSFIASGEFNGIILNNKIEYYEYIFYNILDREGVNGNIQILINVKYPSSIILNEVTFKKSNTPNSVLYFNKLDRPKNQNTKSSDVYIRPDFDDGIYLFSRHNLKERHISNSSIHFKIKKRNRLSSILYRSGHIITIPIDIVTSPIQLLLLVIHIFKDGAMY